MEVRVLFRALLFVFRRDRGWVFLWLHGSSVDVHFLQVRVSGKSWGAVRHGSLSAPETAVSVFIHHLEKLPEDTASWWGGYECHFRSACIPWIFHRSALRFQVAVDWLESPPWRIRSRRFLPSQRPSVFGAWGCVRSGFGVGCFMADVEPLAQGISHCLHEWR